MNDHDRLAVCMMIGINCGFGMRGVVAAAHYDGTRNFIAMLRDRKRWVRGWVDM